jgi:hypothetical protein
LQVEQLTHLMLELSAQQKVDLYLTQAQWAHATATSTLQFRQASETLTLSQKLLMMYCDKRETGEH